MKYKLLIVIMLLFAACSGAKSDLEIALELAGDNRAELESVLVHYKDDPEKLAAAEFLIENMPFHYSYNDKNIDDYYASALEMFKTGLSPKVQSDSLLKIKRLKYPNLGSNTISDVKIMTRDYLVYSIDHAFTLWETKPWNRAISFDEFCEWLLPYKVVEKQSLDYWRDTLPALFSDDLNQLPDDDDQTGTAFKTLETVRSEMFRKQSPHGIYTELACPMLSASTMARQTFGRCGDYVTAGVATFRSLGLLVAIDESPLWGRHRMGHSWYTMISDRGEQLSSEWDISSTAGRTFFPYEQIPKVFRNKFAVNKERLEYKKKSICKIPFDICKHDITSQYIRVSDIEIPAKNSVEKVEDYAYIYCFNGSSEEWSVVDFGAFDGKKSVFKNIGRNILYLAQYFDGHRLRPLNDPFILHNDGNIEFIKMDSINKISLDIHRKYMQKANVAEMRQRLHGGKIQGADNPDFRNAENIFEIDDVYVLDPQPVTCSKAYKCYRYLSPDGSYGSIAELKFYDADTAEIVGTPIANKAADSTAIRKAFDGNYLSNFETEEPDGNWVGVKASKPQKISFVRIVPRSDDNDIRPGDTYELLYYNGNQWISMGKKVATTNVLHYDNVPSNTLYWVKDHTRGWDERPFLLREGDVVEWR